MRKEESDVPTCPISSRWTKKSIILTSLAVAIFGWLVLRPYAPTKSTTPWTGEIEKPHAKKAASRNSTAASSPAQSSQAKAGITPASHAAERPYGTPVPDRELIASAWKTEEAP